MAVYEDFMTMSGLNTKLVNHYTNEMLMNRFNLDHGKNDLGNVFKSRLISCCGCSFASIAWNFYLFLNLIK